ncbi:spindle and kinetochore-associated protein 1 [Pogoniulus pusillus]|uniref:spindle and kinetochore-associated protein 1 n=1 Tax=Pogoniulus pusillus TaxID=488313 RepID=UPI0030B92EF9
MASPDLDSLRVHINAKISYVKKILQLRRTVEDPGLKTVLCKVGKEIGVLHSLLNQMEVEVQQQEKLRDLLKELQKSAEKDQLEAQLLHEYIPHLPKGTKICIAMPTEKNKEQEVAVKPQQPSKPTRKKILIKSMGLITAEEFKGIPAYMRGRITHDQINHTVNEINKAVKSKYKILYQPLKSMNLATRNLYHRFKEEETKDTKGEFFIVEADIAEFTELKMDKRFYSILNMLRHCQRTREIRGSRLVRYIIC